MDNLTKEVFSLLKANGADIVGAADLTELPEDIRQEMPRAVSFAMILPKDVVRGISELPTQEYFDWYCKLNENLDELSEIGADFFVSRGYRGIPMIRSKIWEAIVDNRSKLPLKTIATRAGIGWIGDCALLVTETCGSMLRLGAILTDAPLECAEPINESRCGDCDACKVACPAGAVSGKPWSKGEPRENFFDADVCKKAAAERSFLGFGSTEATICGKCIEICPWTKRYCDSLL